MNYRTGLLVITFLVGSFAAPEPKVDYFLRTDSTSYFSQRIVGGHAAPANSHPHMVALTTGSWVRSFTCGASLISARTVLTAAHCITGSLSGNTVNSNLRAVVGSNQWNSGSAYRLQRGVIHPHYNSRTLNNDVGILITSSAVRLTNAVRPVTLSYANVGANVRVRVAGWGRTAAGAPLSNNLLQVDLTTISGQDCVDRVNWARTALNFPNAPPVYPRVELCTIRAAGFGTCHGDSGSALRRIDNGQQVGIVSWGFPCARGAPDMFARISAFQSFILINTVR